VTGLQEHSPSPAPEPQELSELREPQPSGPPVPRQPRWAQQEPAPWEPAQQVPAPWEPAQQERQALPDRAWQPMAWLLVLRALA